MYQLFQNIITNGLKYRRKNQLPIIQISLAAAVFLRLELYMGDCRFIHPNLALD